MAINMSKLTIILSFIVFGIIQIGAAREFTIDEYIGLWYDVNVIQEREISPYPIKCEWRNVTRRGEENVREVFTFIYKRDITTMEGSVTVADSSVSIKYADGKGGTLHYQVKSYDGGNDLIFIDLKETISSVLLSRNTEASEKAKAEFKHFAASIGGYVHSIENEVCSDFIENNV